MLSQREVLLLRAGARTEAQAGALGQLRWSPGASARGVPHPHGRRRGAAVAPVKVEEENVNSNNSSSSDKRDEMGQKFCSGKIAVRWF